jgi:rare lipoprotein A
MDRMVSALPIASAEAGERKPANAEVEPAPPGPWRFDMRQDGKAMTADEFDAWMKQRRVRVATGKSGTPDPRTVPAAPVKAPARTETAASNDASRAPDPKPMPNSSAGSVVLQVASFAARANAERALAMLEGAGIRDARLFDATASGQKVWRLRVGPVPGEQVAELSATVAGLGFGRPNVVRD